MFVTVCANSVACALLLTVNFCPFEERDVPADLKVVKFSSRMYFNNEDQWWLLDGQEGGDEDEEGGTLCRICIVVVV